MAEDIKTQRDFERVSALFKREGYEQDAHGLALMQPLLSGEMTLEQHENWLLKQLEAVRHDPR